jgi:hypothetical protein
MYRDGLFFETRPSSSGMRASGELDPNDLWARAREAHFRGDETEARALRKEAERRDGTQKSHETRPAPASAFREQRPPVVVPPFDARADRARLEALRNPPRAKAARS